MACLKSMKYHELVKVTPEDILDLSCTDTSISNQNPLKMYRHLYQHNPPFDLLVMGISAVFNWWYREEMAGYWRLSSKERESMLIWGSEGWVLENPRDLTQSLLYSQLRIKIDLCIKLAWYWNGWSMIWGKKWGGGEERASWTRVWRKLLNESWIQGCMMC